jgi:hypothetical protein
MLFRILDVGWSFGARVMGLVRGEEGSRRLMRESVGRLGCGK